MIKPWVYVLYILIGQKYTKRNQERQKSSQVHNLLYLDQPHHYKPIFQINTNYDSSKYASL